MKIRQLHRWDVPPVEAIRIQRALARRANLREVRRALRTAAGVDVSYETRSSTLYAAVVVMHLDTHEILETATAVHEVAFPYIPGLLSFREAPAALTAFARLRREPDCVLCDGQGIAHPRRFGLACHLGLVLALPTIGCAKSRLVGESRNPGRRRGSFQILYDKGEKIGMVLRTKDGVGPVYVSPGYRVSLRQARVIVLRAYGGYRVPEPIRRAHLLVNALRRDGDGGVLPGTARRMNVET
jgi:deoxyribonuclease V